MHTNNRPAATVPGYSTGPVTKAPDWHALVAWDLLLNSLATGLFLVAALGELAAPAVFTAVAKVAYPVALVFLLTDLLLLVLDLGDPWRFHHMLRVFKPSSPMSLGTWCLTIYSLPLTVAAGLALLPEGGKIEWLRKLAVVLALLPALGSAAYKGVLLSTNAQPGWRDARWLGAYLTNSAFVLGCAALLALSVVTGEVRATAALRPALVLLLVVNAIPMGLLFQNLRPTLARALSRRQVWRAGLLGMGGGALVPLGLLLAGDSPPLVLGAVACLLVGALVIRFAIVELPHAAPGGGAGRKGQAEGRSSNSFKSAG